MKSIIDISNDTFLYVIFPNLSLDSLMNLRKTNHKFRALVSLYLNTPTNAITIINFNRKSRKSVCNIVDKYHYNEYEDLFEYEDEDHFYEDLFKYEDEVIFEDEDEDAAGGSLALPLNEIYCEGERTIAIIKNKEQYFYKWVRGLWRPHTTTYGMRVYSNDSTMSKYIVESYLKDYNPSKEDYFKEIKEDEEYNDARIFLVFFHKGMKVKVVRAYELPKTASKKDLQRAIECIQELIQQTQQ
jgi:hypothetical protein